MYHYAGKTRKGATGQIGSGFTKWGRTNVPDFPLMVESYLNTLPIVI